jgi:hypothetical protein
MNSDIFEVMTFLVFSKRHSNQIKFLYIFSSDTSFYILGCSYFV